MHPGVLASLKGKQKEFQESTIRVKNRLGSSQFSHIYFAVTKSSRRKKRWPVSGCEDIPQRPEVRPCHERVRVRGVWWSPFCRAPRDRASNREHIQNARDRTTRKTPRRGKAQTKPLLALSHSEQAYATYPPSMVRQALSQLLRRTRPLYPAPARLRSLVRATLVERCPSTRRLLD